MCSFQERYFYKEEAGSYWTMKSYRFVDNIHAMKNPSYIIFTNIYPVLFVLNNTGVPCLQNLWYLLDKYHTPPLAGEEQMISYDNFLKVSLEAVPKCQ